MTDHDSSLDKQLRQWKVDLEAAPQTSRHVLNRISSSRPRATRSRSTPIWILGLSAAAAILLASVFVYNYSERNRLLKDGNYSYLIDPVSRAQATISIRNAGERRDDLVNRLAWLQDRLHLSREQFLELVELHHQYAGRFDSLYEELLRLESRYEEFEDLREHDEMIDFMALYDVLMERKQTEVASKALSQEFISKAISLLKPEQQATYLSLVPRTMVPGDA